ncbi:hypothetical protein PSHT_01722, partial [Puccinia striiformis]
SADADVPWPSDLFQEPSSFRPPSPEPQIIEHTIHDGTCLKIKLVGHVLYPASIRLSRYIQENAKELFPDNLSIKVLELGAGGGLPGLTCALSGASLVVATDFPDPDLIKNLEWNADENLPASLRDRLIVKGLKWGTQLDGDDFQVVQTILPHESTTSSPSTASSSSPGFDLILLSDLVFNHSEHNSLLTTCEISLKNQAPTSKHPTPSLLVFYSHHRPWCVTADEEFFVIARQRGWKCTRIIKDKNAGLAFPADKGDPTIRGTVHGWILTRH